MSFGGYKHSFLLGIYLSVELQNYWIMGDPWYFPSNLIFLELPISVSAITTCLIFTLQIYVLPHLLPHHHSLIYEPFWLQNLTWICLILGSLLLTPSSSPHHPTSGLLKRPPSVSLFPLFPLQSSLHSCQDLINVNHIVSFACLKPSFKFLIKANSFPGLQSPIFYLTATYLWNFLSYHCALATSGLPSWVHQAHSQDSGIRYFLRLSRLFPWSLYD